MRWGCWVRGQEWTCLECYFLLKVYEFLGSEYWSANSFIDEKYVHYFTDFSNCFDHACSILVKPIVISKEICLAAWLSFAIIEVGMCQTIFL